MEPGRPPRRRTTPTATVYVGFPAGVIVLLVALPCLRTLWVRAKFSSKGGCDAGAFDSSWVRLTDALRRRRARSSAQLRSWCAALEAGSVLYFPQTPVPIPPQDIDFLLGQHQTGSRLHKNISYKPDIDVLSGMDKKATTPRGASSNCTPSCAAIRRTWRGFCRTFSPPIRTGGNWIMPAIGPSKRRDATCPCGAATTCSTSTRFPPGRPRLADPALLPQHPSRSHPRLGRGRAISQGRDQLCAAQAGRCRGRSAPLPAPPGRSLPPPAWAAWSRNGNAPRTTSS